MRSELRWQDWWENEVETINSDHPFNWVTSAEKRKGSSVIGHSCVYVCFTGSTLREHVKKVMAEHRRSDPVRQNSHRDLLGC